MMLARFCAGLDTRRVPLTRERKETEEEAMVNVEWGKVPTVGGLIGFYNRLSTLTLALPMRTHQHVNIAANRVRIVEHAKTAGGTPASS